MAYEVTYLPGDVFRLETGPDHTIAVHEHQPFRICLVSFLIHEILHLERVRQNYVNAAILEHEVQV